MYIKFGIENIYFDIDKIKKALTDDSAFEKALVKTANTVRKETADFVEITAKRTPTAGKLEDAIRSSKVEVQYEGTTIYVDIIPVADLASKVPYWYALNYGRTASGKPFIPKASIGYFPGHTRPEAGHTGNEVWTETGDTKNDFLLQPVEFTPLNYIEHAANITSSIWERNFASAFKEKISKMKK